MFKSIIQRRLERYVRRYLARHSDIRVVIVTGSVGKTSTKSAIATVLQQSLRVRVHLGNHNAELSAPLAMLGIDYPRSIRNPFSWLRVFAQARRRITAPRDIDVIVQEVGSDRIGQVAHFGSYVQPDIAVVSAVSPEHMEYFQTLDAVAAEELAPAAFSKTLIINRDSIHQKYRDQISHNDVVDYGIDPSADYSIAINEFSAESGYSVTATLPDQRTIQTPVHVIGDHALLAVAGAVAVADRLGLDSAAIAKGVAAIDPVSGRMNPLAGKKESLIIDDSYNASPLAVQAALDTLYSLAAPQKIAVLGSMNELGDSSAAEHQAIGAYCDPSHLDYVVTVGHDAREHLAPQAIERGCKVVSFLSAIDAGQYVLDNLAQGAVILVKGSQGGVYLEEAVKLLLSDQADQSQLVRQSSEWLAKKARYFDSL